MMVPRDSAETFVQRELLLPPTDEIVSSGSYTIGRSYLRKVAKGV